MPTGIENLKALVMKRHDNSVEGSYESMSVRPGSSDNDGHALGYGDTILISSRGRPSRVQPRVTGNSHAWLPSATPITSLSEPIGGIRIPENMPRSRPVRVRRQSA